jgi:hypothetical protein
VPRGWFTRRHAGGRSVPSPERDPQPIAGGQGLEVSRGDVLQHQLLQAQLTDQPLQLRVLRLQLLQPSSLIHLQATVLFAPSIKRLLRDLSLFTRQNSRLPVRNSNFDLPKQVHNLLPTVFLRSCSRSSK